MSSGILPSVCRISRHSDSGRDGAAYAAGETVHVAVNGPGQR